jgi:pimeloyl-ACP methyl ester carboxylesterase
LNNYTITQTNEKIRFFYLQGSLSKPTLVLFPGIGIGPMPYKKFIDLVDNSILIVDCPNVNICHHYFTDKIFLDVIYRRIIEYLKNLEVESIILFGHSFGTINVSNFIYNNLKSESVIIKKIFLVDPICFFAGFARLYASIYRYLNTPQRSITNRFCFNMLHGDIGNQYMFYRQLKPYIGTYHFSIEDDDEQEDKEKYEKIQKNTVVFVAQKDSYVNYPTLWYHLNKFFPLVTKYNYYGYHGDFIFDKNTYEIVVNHIKNMD